MTAGRLRAAIETVLDWAKARGYRDGENPARWRGHLDKLLPARSKVRTVEHMPSMPYADVPAFLAELRQRTDTAARALDFTILTAVRTGDIRGQEREYAPPMRWEHVDLDAALWTIPKGKNGKEHRVPLSPSAVSLLKGLPRTGRHRVSWAPAGQADQQRRNAARARRDGPQCDDARYARELQDVGKRANPCRARSRGSVPRAYDQRRIGSRLPPRRFSRQATPVDGRMGRLLRHAGNGRHTGAAQEARVDTAPHRVLAKGRVLGVCTRWPIVAAAWTDDLGVVMAEGLEDGLNVYEPIGLGAWRGRLAPGPRSRRSGPGRRQ